MREGQVSWPDEVTHALSARERAMVLGRHLDVANQEGPCRIGTEALDAASGIAVAAIGCTTSLDSVVGKAVSDVTFVSGSSSCAAP